MDGPDTNVIPDEEFRGFLHSLGVETFNQSFEWMFHDPEFATVLHWIYKNIDQNNVLTPHEEYRYAELEKHGKLLPKDELMNTVAALQNEYPGICLPGDSESLEDMKLDTKDKKEKIAMLEKQEKILKDLIVENEKINDELSADIIKLNAVHKQCTEESETLGKECVQLALDMEDNTNQVNDLIHETLTRYANCSIDKETAKKFFTYGPFESYKLSQMLFKSHFDLFRSKQFDNIQSEGKSNECIRTALIEAKKLEARLTDAMSVYIDTKAELSGGQAKLALVSNYMGTTLNPTQITIQVMECKSAISLLEQEESILEQQLQHQVNSFAEERTRLAEQTIARSALNVRQQIYADLSLLEGVTREAVVLDRLVYAALRRELLSFVELLHFATELKSHVLMEEDGTARRVKAMNDICAEQEVAERNIELNNQLLSTIVSIFRPEAGSAGSDALLPIQLNNQLDISINELRDYIPKLFKKKEEYLKEIKTSRKPLEEYIYSGCTRHPRTCDPGVALMSHALQRRVDCADARVRAVSSDFVTVRNGDKNHLRKLWQYFLTDEHKFLEYINDV